MRSPGWQPTLPNDVDDAVHMYNTVLSDLLDKHAPLKTRSVTVRNPQPWMNDDIMEKKRLRRKHEKLSRKNKNNPDHRRDYMNKCMAVRDLITKAKTQYFLDKIENCEGDQKSLFNIVNLLLGRGKPTELPRLQSNAVLSEGFNGFFASKIVTIQTTLDEMKSTTTPLSINLQAALCRSLNKMEEFSPCSTDEVDKVCRNSSKASCQLDPMPTNILRELPSLIPIITHITNLSLSSGYFPSELKSAIIKPLLKKSTLDPDDFQNFRPVSNLSFLSKVIEKIVAAQLLKHLEKNNLLDKMQSAYKSGHSTETALLRVHNDIMMAVDKKKHVFLVLLDLSAAFDTVDHEILLHFLKEHVGLSGSVFRMFETYLKDRTQCVSIHNALSSLSQLVFGVPQGSVLGPIIFCMYTPPLGAIIQSHKLMYHIYADDTQLYFTCDVDSSADALACVEACIRDIRSWMITNKLKINDKKTEFLIISSPRAPMQLDVNITIGTSTIPPSASCRNLGVMFDKKACMDDQITSLCRSAHFHLRNIRAIRNLLTDSAAAQLVHALVTARIDYCNSFLYGIPDYKLTKLQRVHNIACRIVCNIRKFDHITPHMFDLHWLPIKMRVRFKVLLLTYKAYNGMAPAYLCDLVKPYVPGWPGLRSENQCQLERTVTRLKSYGDRSFQFAAIQEWHCLPQNIRESKSLEIFKKDLKLHLFKLAYLW